MSKHSWREAFWNIGVCHLPWFYWFCIICQHEVYSKQMKKNCANLCFKLQYFFYQKASIITLDKGLLLHTCNHQDEHNWWDAYQNTYIGTSCTWTSEDPGTSKKNPLDFTWLYLTSLQIMVKPPKSAFCTPWEVVRTPPPHGILRTLKSGQVSLWSFVHLKHCSYCPKRYFAHFKVHMGMRMKRCTFYQTPLFSTTKCFGSKRISQSKR